MSGLFPQRWELPKAHVFPKNDRQRQTIVEIPREKFSRGNRFAQRINYCGHQVGGAKPEELIKALSTSYDPSVAVTGDTIVT
jgi:hypothetical protein